MITITRRLALEAATLARRMLKLRGKRGDNLLAQINSGPQGLTIQACTAQFAFEYRTLVPAESCASTAVTGSPTISTGSRSLPRKGSERARFSALKAATSGSSFSKPRVRRCYLSARHKLNMGYIYGSLAVAAIVGALMQSWILFLLVAGVLILGGLHDGNIRPNARMGR